MNLRSLRIGARLGGAFGVILAILALMVVIGNVLTTQNKQKLIAGLERSNAKAALVATMKSALLQSGISMRNIGLQADVSAMQQEEARVKAQNKTQNKHNDKTHKKQTTHKHNPDETKIVDEISRIDQQIAAPFKEAIGQA